VPRASGLLSPESTVALALMSIKAVIKKLTPKPVRMLSRRLWWLAIEARDKKKPTKEVFTQIYSENLWGEKQPFADKDFPFYSGLGSDEEAAAPFVDCVRAFIKDHNPRSVVDLGCGDFRVGSRIANESLRYTGVDIVEPLIRANQTKFGNDHIEFRCLDIITDDLPAGDLCLVRQVLQHLSNAQITRILSKLKQFKWVIVTEGWPGPAGTFKPNRDKAQGHQVRSVWNSAVVLTEPPFNIPGVEVLDSSIRGDDKGKEYIYTFLISNPTR
jgi:SAM-dependent methyltransferase